MSSSPRPISSLTRSELLLLFVLAGVQFTHIMDFMIIMPLGPQLMRLFQISPREFGFIVSAYTFAAGLSGFLSAFVIDRFDRKSALIVSYLGFTVGTLACAIAPNYLFLLLTRSLAGAFGGVLGALIFSIVGDAIPGERRGRAMGTVMASFSLASVFGVPFGLYLAGLMSWHAPFVFVGGAAAVNTILILFFVPSMRKHLHSDRPRQSPAKLLVAIGGDANQRRALLFTFVLMFSQFLIIPFLSPSLVANAGFMENQLPYIYFFGGGLTIFTSPIVGRLTDRFGRALIFTVSAFLALIPAVLITQLGPTPLPLVLAITTSFFVLGNGRMVPSMAMVTSTVRPETRGGFMSINSSLQSLAAGCAAFCSGLIVARGDNGTLLHFDLVGYLSVALSIVAIWAGRRLVAVD